MLRYHVDHYLNIRIISLLVRDGVNPSKSGKPILNKSNQNNAIVRGFGLALIIILLPIGVISTMIWLNNSATRTTHFLMQDANSPLDLCSSYGDR